MAHPVSMHIDVAIGSLPGAQFNLACEAVGALLTEVHLTAAQEGGKRTVALVERLAGELGIEISHHEED